MVRVVVAGEGDLASRLAGWYAAAGAEVAAISFSRELEPQVATAPGQVDLLVVADDFAPPIGSVGTLDRTTLQHAMHRLTFLPFRVAALLEPQLAAAKGKAVLLCRQDARMDVPDPDGRYLDRPCRTAAHALWRCLSVEWQAADVKVGLVALEPDAKPSMAELAEVISRRDNEAHPVELIDIKGRVLGW